MSLSRYTQRYAAAANIALRKAGMDAGVMINYADKADETYLQFNSWLKQAIDWRVIKYKAAYQDPELDMAIAEVDYALAAIWGVKLVDMQKILDDTISRACADRDSSLHVKREEASGREV